MRNTAADIRSDLHDYSHIRAKYNEAKEAGDEVGMNLARSWMSNLMAGIHEADEEYNFIWRLFKERYERGNTYIVIEELNEDNAGRLVEVLKKYGIEEFVYASSWSSAVNGAWALTEAGCEVIGMTTVNSQHKEFMSDRFEEEPGYLFRITNHAPSKED